MIETEGIESDSRRESLFSSFNEEEINEGVKIQCTIFKKNLKNMNQMVTTEYGSNVQNDSPMKTPIKGEMAENN